MSARVVIEDPCKHGMDWGPHHGPNHDTCQGGSRRVLEPGKFTELMAQSIYPAVAEVFGSRKFWDVIGVTERAFVDALASLSAEGSTE